jgi:hypothetical protein
MAEVAGAVKLRWFEDIGGEHSVQRPDLSLLKYPKRSRSVLDIGINLAMEYKDNSNFISRSPNGNIEPLDD